MRPLDCQLVQNPWKYQFCYLEKGVLKLCLAPTIKPRKIEHSGFFFYWITTDKPELTDWSEVQRRLGSREIAIFRQRMIIMPPPGIIRVKKIQSCLFTHHWTLYDNLDFCSINTERTNYPFNYWYFEYYYILNNN